MAFTRSRSDRVPRARLVALGMVLACSDGAREPAAAPLSLDRRTAVGLPPEGQQAVLQEMRQLLGAIGGALAGAASGDTAAILRAVAPAGSAAAADPALEAMLPLPWKELAERTHAAFDTLAGAVRLARGTAALRDTVLVRLASVTTHCASCHEMFRVTVQ